MAGNFNKRDSSLERRMRKHTLFYWKKVGKHSFQMRKMTLHYFNKLKPGEDFFSGQNIALPNLKNLKLKKF